MRGLGKIARNRLAEATSVRTVKDHFYGIKHPSSKMDFKTWIKKDKAKYDDFKESCERYTATICKDEPKICEILLNGIFNQFLIRFLEDEECNPKGELKNWATFQELFKSKEYSFLEVNMKRMFKENFEAFNKDLTLEPISPEEEVDE